MKEFFRMVNRITAKQIYVPKILRKYVPTVETKSGTRLKSSINYTPCCTELPKKQKDCVNGIDSDTCRYNGVCDYC